MKGQEGELPPRVVRGKKIPLRITVSDLCLKPLSNASNLSRLGFTLVEMLVAMTITSLIVVLLLGLIQSTTTIWQRNSDRSKAFASARAAFESISRSISAATLNPYQDYYDASRKTRPSGSLTFQPNVYGRNSELHFITGNELVSDQIGSAIFLNVPFDFDNTTATPATGGQLNGIGFFVRFCTDTTLPDFIINNPPRYRLFQFLQPTTNLTVMSSAWRSDSSKANTWFTSDTNANPAKNCYPLAMNIVAFAVLPKLSERENPALDSLTTNYSYDTRMTSTPWTTGAQPTNMHQLPPVVRVVMVTLDERSAARIENGATPPDLGYDPATVFNTADDLETSLDTIAAKLSEKNLSYRIFRADIPVGGAKWSAN